MKKQKKRQKLIFIILCVIFCFLCGFYGWLKGYEPSVKAAAVSPERVAILDGNPYDVTAMEVKNKEGEYRVIREGGMWGLEGVDRSLLNQAMLELCISSASYLYGETVAEDGCDEEVFGLKEPEATITLERKDDRISFYLGKDAPTGGHYVQLKPGGTVYLVRDTGLNMLKGNKLAFLDKKIMQTVGDDSADTQRVPEQVILSGNIRKETLNLELETLEDAGGQQIRYRMTKPRQWELYRQDLPDIFATIFKLEALEAVAYQPTEEELKEYGLLEEYSVLEAGWENGAGVKEQVKLVVSRPKDGSCYMTKEGTDVIFRISEEAVPWCEMTYEDMFSTLLLLPIIDELARIQVEGDGRSWIYELENTKQGLKAYTSEKEVDMERFKKLYQSLIGMPAETYTEKPPAEGAETFLRITYQYEDGRQADVVELVEGEPLEMYIVVNGQAEFLTRKSYLDILRWNLNVLEGEEEIKFYY